MKDNYEKWLAPGITLVALAAWALAIASNYRIEEFNNDTAQYISTARFLLAGEGLKTDILYYELQHELGMPAPQTVWPPGYPAAIAAIAAFGVDFKLAAFLVAAISYAAATILLYLIVKRSTRSKFWAAVMSVTWLAFVGGTSSVLAADSEPLFTALSLAAALAMLCAITEERWRFRILLLAGLLSAVACTVRFVGIALVPALAAIPFVTFLHRRQMRDLLACIAVSAPPVIALSAMFHRNFQLVGSMSGGPRVEGDSTLAEMARHTWWSIKNILGVPTTTTLTILVLLFIAVAGVIWMTVAFRQVRQHDPFAKVLTRTAPSTVLTVFSAIYAAATISIVFRLAAEGTAGYIQPRYFVPLVPFFLAILASLTHSLWASNSLAARRALTAAGLLASLGYITGQYNALSNLVDRMSGGTRSDIVRALNQPTGETTVGRLIQQFTDDGSAILSDQAQFLGMVLDRPAVGLPQQMYSHQIWDDHAVALLARNLNVSLICVFQFRKDSATYSNQPFLNDLAHGHTPDWLTPVLETDQIRLYATHSSM